MKLFHFLKWNSASKGMKLPTKLSPAAAARIRTKAKGGK